MTDFGIGIASKSLTEPTKTIWKLYEELKANKASAKQLAQACEDIHFGLMRIFEDAKCSGLTEGRIYDTIRQYLRNFHQVLDEIILSMKEWVAHKLWDRFIMMRKMAGMIQVYHQKLLVSWQQLHAALALQNAAGNSIIHAEVNEVKNAVANMARAQTEDNCANTRDMSAAAATLRNSSLHQSDIKLYPGYTNILENRDDVVQSLKNTQLDGADATEDPEFVNARNRLVQALESYNGDRPLFTVDSSELTIPVKVYQGQYGTIFQGIRRGKVVAIKKANIELGPSVVATVYRRINRESKIWAALEHPNVVQFMGCCGPADQFPFMICDWMPNGNVRQYVEKHPGVDCVKLCLDVAQGLAYIHTLPTPIVHGGLKGTNILIDKEGTAKLADFALASVAADIDMQASRASPLRWSSPEVLEGGQNTLATDIYSFACVVIEIFTEEDPFPDETHLHRLHNSVRKGQRPKFPDSEKMRNRGLTSRKSVLWLLMQACWSAEPDKRPSAVALRDTMIDIWAQLNGKPVSQKQQAQSEERHQDPPATVPAPVLPSDPTPTTVPAPLPSLISQSPHISSLPPPCPTVTEATNLDILKDTDGDFSNAMSGPSQGERPQGRLAYVTNWVLGWWNGSQMGNIDSWH